MLDDVTGAREGDPASRERLLQQTRPVVLRWARALVSDETTAEDVTQEALLEVWRTLPGLREPAAYLGWVRLVVRKHADRHRRALRPVSALGDLDLATSELGPAELAAAQAQDEQVRRVLALAPDADQRLLLLRYRQGLTDTELAGLLGISTGAVRKRLFDARQRLKPALAASLDLPLNPRSTTMTAPFGHVTTVEHGELPVVEPLIDETPLVTGIRVLDTLLPWPRAGLVDVSGPVGTGQLVLLGEVLSGLLRDRPSALVGVSSAQRSDDRSSANLHLIVEDEAGQPERSVVLRGPAGPALAVGYERAASLAREGVTVLLVVDRGIAESVGLEVLERLPLALAHGSVTVVRCAPWAREAVPVPEWGAAHTRVVLGVEQALLGIYPSVDLLASSSRLVDSALAAAAREPLLRARAVQSFIAQPFVTAEDFTGTPGERFTAHEAMTQLRAVLA